MYWTNRQLNIKWKQAYENGIVHSEFTSSILIIISNFQILILNLVVHDIENSLKLYYAERQVNYHHRALWVRFWIFKSDTSLSVFIVS